MDEHQFYEREYELRFLKSHGEAFHELFASIMERGYPGDFLRIRPHGRSGDFKCDGYLTSQRIVFQVYGPERLVLRRLLQKLREDFAGAKWHWAARMDRWVFVHNLPAGLPPQAAQVLDDLRNQPGAPQVAAWGYEELRRELNQLEPAAVRSLFPGLSGSADLHSAQRLPKPDEVERYWKWLAAKMPGPTPVPHLEALQTLNLPIRLETPQQAHNRFDRGKLAAIRRTSRPDPGPLETGDSGLAPARTQSTINLAHILRNHRHLLVVGDAGSGKSTLLQRFAAREANYLLTSTLARAHRQTPILVELWRFGLDRPVLDLLVGGVQQSGVSITRDEILAAVERGYVVVLLDGLDEVPLDHRPECLAQIATFIEQYPRARTVLTSRPFPHPPLSHFHRLNVAPLTDDDIATALQARFGWGQAFRERFDNYLPREYVNVHLRPEVRDICRQPLTLGLMLTLLASDDRLPEALFGVYDRFLSLLLDWEVRKGHLATAATAAVVLEETAHFMAEYDQVSIPAANWVRVAGRAVSKSRTLGVLANVSAEDVFRLLLSTGLVRDLGGEVSFSHQTFLEFLAARYILAAEDHTDPVSLNPGVARFLCGGMRDATALLEEHLLRCKGVEELMLLLEEASRHGSSGDRFEALYDAIVLGQELGIHLTYSLRGPEEVQFAELIDQIVQTCIGFKPKALSVLKDSASGVLTAVQWEQSRFWFERIVAGLEACGWAGAPLHRRLAEIGVFESMETFVDDGTDPTACERLEDLFGYLGAMDNDDFEKASRHLARIEIVLRGESESS